MKVIETPCFVLNTEELQLSINEFVKAQKKYFPNSILSYSVKTNSLPYLLNFLKAKNVYAEVVSYDEYDLAIECGFDIQNIVYNGPMKSKETFLEAVKNNAYVNIETKREIEWLSELPYREEPYGVGIRINVDMNIVSPEDSKKNEYESRFGFSYESGELEKAITKMKEIKGVKLKGIHLHRTTATRSLNFYKSLSEYALRIIKALELKLKYIDIGGGYYGIFKNKPKYDDYMKVIYLVFKNQIDLNNTTIIVEPGNAIVASCFSFYSSVIDVKTNLLQREITTDGSRNDIDPFYSKNKYFYEILPYRSEAKKNKISLQQINGCTCLENDKIMSLKDFIEIEVGDIIKYNNVGAYTMCLSPNFIRFLPKVYIEKNNKYILVRDSWTVKEFIKKSK